ncbi:MAG TPA: DUF2590 family protein [bacterium]
MAGEYDLQIVDGDLAFGLDDEPMYLQGAEAVAQDVKHRLVDSGTPVDLIGDDDDRTPTLNRIALLVEDDLRIKPGTAKVTESGETFSITARTINEEAIEV